MKLLLIYLSFVFFPGLIYAQIINEKDTIKINTLLDSANKNLSTNVCIARTIATEALEIAVNINHQEKQAKALMFIGNTYKIELKFKEALIYFEKVQLLAEKNNFTKLNALASGTISVISEKLGNYNFAIAKYLKTIDLFKSINDSLGVCKCFNNIGKLYCLVGNNTEALKYYISGLKIAERIDNKILIVSCLNNMAVLYQEMNKNSEALSIFYKIISLTNESKDSIGMANAYNNIGLTYQSLNKYDLCAEYYFKALEIRKIINDIYGIAMSYNNLGSFYFDKKEYSMSLNYFLEAINISLK